MTALSLAALVLVPAIAGGALLLVGRRASGIAVPVSLAAATLTVVAALVAAATRPTLEIPFVAGASVGLGVDGLSALIVPAVAVVALMVLIFAAAEGVESPARFHGLMLLFVAAVAITATATTLPALLFAWELMGAMSYALIGFDWRDERRVSSGLTAFLATRAGDLGLYLAAGAAIAGGSDLTLASLASTPSPWRDVIAAGILLAAFGKAAQLPFSFWISRAMAGPSPVSALLHSAAMVAMGGYLLLRVSPLLQAVSWAAITAAWVGAVTALVLGAVAVAQRDLKQLLAASTAAQLGFVVLAAGVGSVSGGTAYLIAHAATKALLFLAAGAWLTALGTKQLAALRGAARRWPFVGVTFAIGALSLAGVAPLSLWAAKDEVLAAARESGIALYLVGMVAAALSAVYAGKALVVLWRQQGTNAESGYDLEQPGTRRIVFWQRMPLLVLAAGAATLGVLSLPPIGDAVRSMLGVEGAQSIVPIELLGSAALALAMLALVAWKGAPEPAWAANWLGLERVGRVVIAGPIRRTSTALARFDDATLDAGITSIARATVRGASRLGGFDDARLDAGVTAIARGGVSAASGTARIDRDGVDASVESIATAARRLGRAARRPQTGQLHQYYVQISVIVGVALVLLLVVR